MPEEMISVIDVATQYGKRKATIFKLLKRIGIESRKIRSTANGGQLISYITTADFRRVSEELQPVEGSKDLATSIAGTASDVALTEEGLFYLLLLEPEHDPGRFKVGFAVSLPERLRALRCSAPFTKVVKT